VQGCRYKKLIDLIHNNNRCWNYENTIITKGFLLLVDIVTVSLIELGLLIAGTMSPPYRNFLGCYACIPILRFHDFDSNMLRNLHSKSMHMVEIAMNP
jgi:hypothetical protein